MTAIPSSRIRTLSAFLALTLTACGSGTATSSAQGEGAGEADAVSAHDAAPQPSTATGWAEGTHVELTPEEAEAIQLESVPAERRSLASLLPAMGQVVADPYRQAIVSYPFSARIAEIQVRLGEWVEPGDPLVVLQSAEVGEATSAFYRALADHELAEASYQRENQLYQNGVGARKDFTSAETELRVARANLDAAEKKLHLLGLTEEGVRDLAESHQVNPTVALHAPIRGKVVVSNAVLGGMVDESTEILTILDPTRLWVEAAIYEKDIARVRVGQKVRVTVAAYPEEVFEGTVASISDLLDPETRAITVRTEVPNPGQKLKPGMFADLVLELSMNGQALSVPSEAVLDDQGRSVVFVETAPLHYEPRLVTLGARQNGFLEIAGGLEAGEAVVTRGSFQLKSKLNEALLHAAHVH